jgi:hypothetical protein
MHISDWLAIIQCSAVWAIVEASDRLKASEDKLDVLNLEKRKDGRSGLNYKGRAVT